MNTSDPEIRQALRGLLDAPVPPVPHLEPRPLPRLESRWGSITAAAAMLASLLAVVLWPQGSTEPPEVRSVAERIESVEQRIARLDDPELRALFAREAALLRRELELAGRPIP